MVFFSVVASLYVLVCGQSFWKGGVAQLVERRTGTPLRQVRLTGAARDFTPSQLSVQTLFRCPYTLLCNRMH